MSHEISDLLVKIYTDEDVTSALAPALRRRGYTAQSTDEAGHPGRSDEFQLDYATQQGTTILTYNAQDFISLAQARYFTDQVHAGIILSSQFEQSQFGLLLRQVLRLLNDLTAHEMKNRVIFLQQYK